MRPKDGLDTPHLSRPGTTIIITILIVTILPTKDNLMGLAVKAPIIKIRSRTLLESGW